jgi:hypothetical protein
LIATIDTDKLMLKTLEGEDEETANGKYLLDCKMAQFLFTVATPIVPELRKC